MKKLRFKKGTHTLHVPMSSPLSECKYLEEAIKYARELVGYSKSSTAKAVLTVREESLWNVEMEVIIEKK